MRDGCPLRLLKHVDIWVYSEPQFFLLRCEDLGVRDAVVSSPP